MSIREQITALAQAVGRAEQALAEAAPVADEHLATYFHRALVQYLKAPAHRPQHPASAQMLNFLSVALYKIHGRDRAPEELRTLSLQNQLTPEQGALVFSLFRECMTWEPVTETDLREIICLDRSIVRSARVAAETVDPERFLQWLTAEHSGIDDGEALLQNATELLTELSEQSDSEEALLQAHERFTRLARRALRNFGAKKGRNGLASIRNQLSGEQDSSAAPKTHLQFSEAVIQLAGHYVRLSLAERRALKVLIHRLDTASHGEQKNTFAPPKEE